MRSTSSKSEKGDPPSGWRSGVRALLDWAGVAVDPRLPFLWGLLLCVLYLLCFLYLFQYRQTGSALGLGLFGDVGPFWSWFYFPFRSILYKPVSLFGMEGLFGGEEDGLPSGPSLFWVLLFLGSSCALAEVWAFRRLSRLGGTALAKPQLLFLKVATSLVLGSLLIPLAGFSFPLALPALWGYLTYASDRSFELLLPFVLLSSLLFSVGAELSQGLAMAFASFVSCGYFWWVSSRFAFGRVKVYAHAITSGALAGLAYSLASWNPGVVLFSAFASSAWHLLWCVVALVSLPLLEGLFDLISPFRLMELADPSHPLLRRLQMEAPGTYYHSLVVGNMAEMAAEALGLHGMLVRVGAYYHDIGKLKRPSFFVENQGGGENVHEKLSPFMSCSIITSHVSHGVELAKQYGLPSCVVDFISQHHGDTCLSYFYKKALAEGAVSVRREDFCYPGPKPMRKEVALIMLADSVEAAFRSEERRISGFDSIKGLVKEVIMNKHKEGQLDRVDFTFRELDLISEAFARVLMGAHHSRELKPLVEGEEGTSPLRLKGAGGG